MRDKPCLTEADILKAMAACRAEADKNNWKVAIAIVDDGGYLLHFNRMKAWLRSRPRSPSARRAQPR